MRGGASGLTASRCHRIPDRIRTSDGCRHVGGPLACGLVVAAAGPGRDDCWNRWEFRLVHSTGQGADRALERKPADSAARIVEHGTNYLVPRDDGRVLVGATEEDAGFDTRPTQVAARIPYWRKPTGCAPPSLIARSKRPGRAYAPATRMGSPTSASCLGWKTSSSLPDTSAPACSSRRGPPISCPISSAVANLESRSARSCRAESRRVIPRTHSAPD